MRNGQKYWVKPYDNKRTVKPQENSSRMRFKKVDTSGYKVKDNVKDKVYNQHPDKFVNLDEEGISDKNYLLEFAIETAKDIQDMDTGEKAHFDESLKNCKGIVSNLGYLDENILHLFKPAEVEKELLEPKNIRVVRAINKEAKKIYLRVNDSKLKRHVASIVENTRV